MSRKTFIGFAAYAVLILAATPASVSIFFGTLGFEDDVDIVVDPGGNFVVVPEENEDGTDAKVTIIDLDAATGAPLGITFVLDDVFGFENGVDPMVMHPTESGSIVLVPTESENGLVAGIHVLEVDATTGALMRMEFIDLGDLGFREDVDGTWIDTPNAVAFFPLEKEDGSERGIIAIDIKSGDLPDLDFAGCSLLSTDGRKVCEENIEVDWLPGLADGVDGACFNDLCVDGVLCTRLIVPVSSVGGNDLLLVDFNALDDCVGCDHPLFLQYTSAKAVNAGGATPTDFPGFERDVDILLSAGGCVDANKILVPVEGPGDVGDVYLLNSDGTADWVLSIDGGTGVPAIPGFQTGVDVVRMCGLGGASPSRLVVPIENAAGTDADLWIVDFETGVRLASAEANNPNLVIPGYEIGVDPYLWSGEFVAVPTEDSDGEGTLMVFNSDAILVGAETFTDFGFVRSVDPIVSPVPPFYPMFVPIMSTDGADADVLKFPGPPPAFPGLSVEGMNDDLTFGTFEWDVDVGLIHNASPGNGYVYLPEEDDAGESARLRFEPFPTLATLRLIVATKELGGLPSALYFILAGTGFKEFEFADVLGLETGLDLASGRGPIVLTDPPGAPLPGQDADTDPTLGWDTTTDVRRGLHRAPGFRIPVDHMNPFAAPGSIEYVLPERGRVTVDVFDVGGRMVSRVYRGVQGEGEHRLTWSAVDDRGHKLPSGIYFVRVSAGDAQGVSKLVLVR
jgi:FlgD Ig-like domain